MQAPAPVRNTPEVLELAQRRPRVTLEGTPRYWLDRDPVKTHFLNALSILIPAVEFVVIGILRRYRDRIPDVKVRADAQSVIRQESAHAAVHTLCNRLLTAAGYAAAPRLDRLLRGVLGLVCRLLSARAELAIPTLFEVYTSALSRDVLVHRERWFGAEGRSDPDARAVVVWHALEEVEHQAVCGDVYRQVYRGHLVPAVLLVLLTPLMVLWLLATHGYLLACDAWSRRPVSLAAFVRFTVAADSPYRLLLRQSFHLFGKDVHTWNGYPLQPLRTELAAISRR